VVQQIVGFEPRQALGLGVESCDPPLLIHDGDRASEAVAEEMGEIQVLLKYVQSAHVNTRHSSMRLSCALKLSANLRLADAQDYIG